MVKLGDNLIVVVVSICLQIWHLGLLHGRLPFWIGFFARELFTSMFRKFGGCFWALIGWFEKVDGSDFSVESCSQSLKMVFISDLVDGW